MIAQSKFIHLRACRATPQHPKWNDLYSLISLCLNYRFSSLWDVYRVQYTHAKCSIDRVGFHLLKQMKENWSIRILDGYLNELMPNFWFENLIVRWRNQPVYASNFETVFWSLKWTNLSKIYWITISLYSWIFWRIFFCFKALWTSENYSKVGYRSPAWGHFQTSWSPQYKPLFIWILPPENYFDSMKRWSTFTTFILQKWDFFHIAYLHSEWLNRF